MTFRCPGQLEGKKHGSNLRKLSCFDAPGVYYKKDENIVTGEDVAILKKGIVQIYTGNGKGKTTAALGLACRMLGRGGKV